MDKRVNFYPFQGEWTVICAYSRDDSLSQFRGALAMSPCCTTATSYFFKMSPIANNFDNLQFLTYIMVRGSSYDPVSCVLISKGSAGAVHLGGGF